MHSFLALFLLEISIGIIYPAFMWPFGVGFLSHLASDIFNRRKVQLLYPIPGGIRLALFSAKGDANSIFLWIACAVIAVELIKFVFKEAIAIRDQHISPKRCEAYRLNRRSNTVAKARSADRKT